MEKSEKKDVMYKVWDLERELAVSRATIYRWCKNGQIKFIRLPPGYIRIPYEEVQRLKCESK